MTVLNTMIVVLSASVGPMRSAIIWATGTPEISEMPRSPRKDLPRPQNELHIQRLVEPHLDTDLLQLLRGGGIASNDGRGITWRQTKNGKDNDGHNPHDGDCGHEPRSDIREHRYVNIISRPTVPS